MVECFGFTRGFKFNRFYPFPFTDSRRLGRLDDVGRREFEVSLAEDIRDIDIRKSAKAYLGSRARIPSGT